MSDVLVQSIEALAGKIDQDEQSFAETMNRRKALVNGLCAEAGVEPRYPNLGDTLAASPAARASSSPVAIYSNIKPDQFYGQSLSGSIRKVLEMRKAAGLGPAEVRDVYEVLVRGGYAFDTKNTETAVQGLTVSIGKNSALFVKLPNGQVGLKEWYPGARVSRKRDNGGDDGSDVGEQQASQQPAPEEEK